MNLSPIVSKHIPEFVNDDYPLFVKFIKTYYKWLDETQINSIEDVVDIDNTIDSFIKYFRSALDIHGIKYRHIDERIYLKHVKQFFLAKGSEAAYWFLFRILFNVDSAIIRPWDYTFIPSNAKWEQDNTIVVKLFYGDGYKLVANKLIIIGDDKKEYPCYIKNAIQIRPDVFELYLTKPLSGNIRPKNIIQSIDGSIKGRLEPVITNLVIERPGQYFISGESYTIDSFGGYGAKILINDVDEDGRIKRAELINFGIGYDTDFNYTLFPNSNEERVYPDYNLLIGHKFFDNEIVYPHTTSATITDDVSIYSQNYLNTNDYFSVLYTVGYTQNFAPTILDITISESVTLNNNFAVSTIKYPSNDILTGVEDGGFIVKHNYGKTPVQYFDDLTYVGKKLGEFNDKPHKEELLSNAALIKFYIGYTCKYPGYYLNKYNVLGQPVFIQDSYYYQIYSYVTALEKPLLYYKSIVENSIHPIGNKLFGKYIPTNEQNINVNVINTLNIVEIEPGYKDRVTVNDDEISFDFDNTKVSSAISDDYYYINFNGVITLNCASSNLITDSIEHIDSILNIIDSDENGINLSETVSISIVYNESVVCTEEVEKKVTKPFTEDINIIEQSVPPYYDSPYFTLTKPFTTDSVTPNDNDFTKYHGLNKIFIEVTNASEGTTVKEIRLKKYDSVTVPNEISVYYDMYVVQTPLTYWDATYYDKEIKTTT